jgi:hypothetical protein
MFILSLRYVMKISKQHLYLLSQGWMTMDLFLAGAEVFVYEIRHGILDCAV